jgi:hypothetical protein
MEGTARGMNTMDSSPWPWPVVSVHQSDSYVARDGYRSPYVLDEDYAAWDEARLERCREHACLDCRQLTWLEAAA